MARLTISGAASMADLLLPALVEGFALREGYGLRREDLDATHVEYLLFDRETGRDLGRFRFRATTSGSVSLWYMVSWNFPRRAISIWKRPAAKAWR